MGQQALSDPARGHGVVNHQHLAICSALRAGIEAAGLPALRLLLLPSPDPGRLPIGSQSLALGDRSRAFQGLRQRVFSLHKARLFALDVLPAAFQQTAHLGLAPSALMVNEKDLGQGLLQERQPAAIQQGRVFPYFGLQPLPR